MTRTARMLDHLGFEVRNLETFVRKLEAGGVTIIQPYRRMRAIRSRRR